MNPPTALSSTTDTSSVAVTASLENQQTVEEYVREYYADTPVLISIARCESQFTHLDKDGSVHRGVVNPNDVGVMQINTDFHAKEAKDLGIDIFSLAGNLEFAKYLYEKEGTAPWDSSKPCWGKYAKQ